MKGQRGGERIVEGTAAAPGIALGVLFTPGAAGALGAMPEGPVAESEVRELANPLCAPWPECADAGAGTPGRQPPERSLLLGEELRVASILAIPQERLAGLICRAGSVLSHGVVVARALGIPAVVGVAGLDLAAGDGRQPALLDGYRGRVILNPGPEVLAGYQRLLEEERARAADLARDRDLPARTTDGFTVELQAKISLLAEIPLAREAGVRSVGLYRSEIPFLVRDTAPGEEAQTALYRELLAAFAPHPVAIRALDAGSDKPLPYLFQAEPNPALGQRGLRLLLAHPGLFLAQLRALLRANAGIGNLRLLLPMVSLAGEVVAARGLLEQAHRQVASSVADCVRPPVGIMVEVPAVALRLEALAEVADFVAIGTNDLAQFVMAADRTNPSLGGLCDPLSPAVLCLIAQAVRAAERRGVPLTVCGEMAGDPLGALLLLGLGVHSLSLSPSGIPRVRRLIRAWSRQEAQGLWKDALMLDSAQAVRALVLKAIEDKGLDELIRPALATHRPSDRNLA